MHILDDLVDDAGIGEGGSVAELILLAGQNLAQDPPHDLARSRLGQIGHAEDGFGCGEGTDGLSHLHDEVFPQRVVDLVAILNADKGIDGLPREFVMDADHGSLANGVVFNERGLDLSGGQSVAGDVDDIVHATADPIVTLVIAGGAVTGEVVALVNVQVSVHVSLVRTPDRACHRWPRLFEGENAFDVIPMEFLAGDWVDDGGLDAEEGQRCGARLSGSYAAQRRDHM